MKNKYVQIQNKYKSDYNELNTNMNKYKYKSDYNNWKTNTYKPRENNVSSFLLCRWFVLNSQSVEND